MKNKKYSYFVDENRQLQWQDKWNRFLGLIVNNRADTNSTIMFFLLFLSFYFLDIL